MSDEGNGGPRRDDARLIAEVRALRTRYADHHGMYPLTDDELDALLAAVDERDALKREACAEADEIPPMPASVTSPRADCARCEALMYADPAAGWRHVDRTLDRDHLARL